MVRAGAARRELRHAKRALARAERGGQKFKNQKGDGKKGIRKPSRPQRNKHGAWRFDKAEDQEDEDYMVVVKDGTAHRVGGEAQGEVPEAEEEAEPERFSSLEKKIRALEKRKKSIGELKQRMRRGFEIDAQQQAKLRTLSEIERELSRFRGLLGKELAEAEEQDEAPSNEEEAAEAAAEAAVEVEVEAEAEAPRVPPRAVREAELAARVLSDAPAEMSRLARQRLLKQAKREERLRRKEAQHLAKGERKRVRMNGRRRRD